MVAFTGGARVNGIIIIVIIIIVGEHGSPPRAHDLRFKRLRFESFVLTAFPGGSS